MFFAPPWPNHSFPDCLLMCIVSVYPYVFAGRRLFLLFRRGPVNPKSVGLSNSLACCRRLLSSLLPSLLPHPRRCPPPSSLLLPPPCQALTQSLPSLTPHTRSLPPLLCHHSHSLPPSLHPPAGYIPFLGHTVALFQAVGKYPCTWDLFAQWAGKSVKPVRVQIFTRHCVAGPIKAVPPATSVAVSQSRHPPPPRQG